MQTLWSIVSTKKSIWLDISSYLIQCFETIHSYINDHGYQCLSLVYLVCVALSLSLSLNIDMFIIEMSTTRVKFEYPAPNFMWVSKLYPEHHIQAQTEINSWRVWSYGFRSHPRCRKSSIWKTCIGALWPKSEFNFRWERWTFGDHRMLQPTCLPKQRQAHPICYIFLKKVTRKR